MKRYGNRAGGNLRPNEKAKLLFLCLIYEEKYRKQSYGWFRRGSKFIVRHC